MASRYDRPPALFAWQARLAADRSAVGVTDDEDRARKRLGEALVDAPAGAWGTVCPARLNAYPRGYLYDEPVAIGTATGGGVTWE